MSSSLPAVPGRVARLAVAALTVVTVVVALLAQVSAPAQADAPRAATAQRKAGSPGSVTGYGFDACVAPSQAVMDAWWERSPYSAVGIYIGGSNRVCKDQIELTAGWVSAQQRTGWHLLPVQVGPQASCSGYADRMSSDLATAKQQGSAEAATAVATARGLGIGPGRTLYYDLEDYDLAPDDCRQAALSFLSGCTDALHGAHYDSGRLLQTRGRHHLARPRGRAGRGVHDAGRDLVRLGQQPCRHGHRRPGARGQLGRPPAHPSVPPRPVGHLRRLHPDHRRQLARSGGRGGAVRAAQAAPPGRQPQREVRRPHGQGRQEGAAEAGPEGDRQGHPQDLGGTSGQGHAAAGQGRLDR
jgi:hypothetical protein